ncbi:hypothetical protein TEA_021943 [Camellia sinensis var. sinensis]|uniref:GRAM domain-containing protein n=1 Tax=Camellia sinensis var. sinensis TaxID=542762 RepID=A0A4S4D9D5_CAMSN|nr:hypothetical protein TEA_021943 [Camellia sinensis var. sinensis]
MQQILAHVSGIAVSSLSVAYPNRLFLEPASGQYHIPPPSNGPLKLKQLSLGLKISETVKGKLSLGAKIIRVGGVEKIFKHNFSIREGEKLSKASQCYFSTTAGPIAGLFISTDKVAFCSERSIKLSYSNGQAVRIHYKLLSAYRKTKELKTESHWSNSNSSNMKTRQLAHVFGTLVSSPLAYLDERTSKRILQDPNSASASASQYQISSSSIGSLKLKQNKVDRMKKLGGKANNLANGIREHVSLGPNISETVKGKLSLGAKIIRVGGVKKIFKNNFSVRDGEKLLKACQCYLSTTAGPIAGLLFISSDKVAFCSERSIKLSSPTGEFIRIRYKVLIPLEKILRANESQNVKRPSRKNPSLCAMEEHPLRYLQSFLERKEEKSVETYILASEKLEHKARKRYAGHVNVETDEFLELMLLDSCFIVEFVRKTSELEPDDEDDPIFSVDWDPMHKEPFMNRKRCELTSTERNYHERWLVSSTKFGEGVVTSSSFFYEGVCNKVNQHCNKVWNVMMAKLRHDYFNSPWATVSTISAVVLLLHTIIQTIASVIPPLD